MSDISVVVPTFNRSSQLSNLLESFTRLRDTLPLEIIIVDDCSSDGTERLMRDWMDSFEGSDVRYIVLDRNGGPARARNEGVLAARGNYIAFTDSDCQVDPDWIRAYSKRLENDGHCVGYGGRVLPTRNDMISRYYTFNRILEPPKSRIYLVTANCIYQKDAIQEVGGFDETIPVPGGEDVGLSFKLYQLGYRFGFEPESVVYHDYRSDFLSFFRTFRNYGRGCRLSTESIFTGDG